MNYFVPLINGENLVSDPQHRLKEWISSELTRLGYGSARMLARHLGVKPDFVSRLKNTDGTKQMRRIDAHMVPPLVAFFGSVPPGFETLADLRCSETAYRSNVRIAADGTEDETMVEKPKEIIIKIKTPQQGTLVVGDNNTVTTNNNHIVTSGTALSAEQALNLDTAVKDVAAARDAPTEDVWKDLCGALNVPDSALITRETYPAAEKLLARWRGGAIRDAVNDKGSK